MLLIIAVVVTLLVAAPLWSPFFGSTPPQPVIRYGEFPFRLEYEINGRIVVVEDTIICKYDGVVVYEMSTKYLKWKGSLASGNKAPLTDAYDVSLLIDEVNKICFFLGEPKYYMGAYEDYDEPNFHTFLWSSTGNPTISTDDL